MDGITVEVGGQWVGPGQDRINALIDELGLDHSPTYDRGDAVVELPGGKVSATAGATRRSARSPWPTCSRPSARSTSWSRPSRSTPRG